MIVRGSGAEVDIVKLKIGLAPESVQHRLGDHSLPYLPLQTRWVKRWRT
jgi:hypothetical protein